MDVNNESIQKCFLKRNHVCTQMRLGLVQPPAYSICRYRVFYGDMDCSGTAELSRKLYQNKTDKTLFWSLAHHPCTFW